MLLLPGPKTVHSLWISLSVSTLCVRTLLCWLIVHRCPAASLLSDRAHAGVARQGAEVEGRDPAGAAEVPVSAWVSELTSECQLLEKFFCWENITVGWNIFGHPSVGSSEMGLFTQSRWAGHSILCRVGGPHEGLGSQTGPRNQWVALAVML